MIGSKLYLAKLITVFYCILLSSCYDEFQVETDSTITVVFSDTSKRPQKAFLDIVKLRICEDSKKAVSSNFHLEDFKSQRYFTTEDIADKRFENGAKNKGTAASLELVFKQDILSQLDLNDIKLNFPDLEKSTYSNFSRKFRNYDYVLCNKKKLIGLSIPLADNIIDISSISSSSCNQLLDSLLCVYSNADILLLDLPVNYSPEPVEERVPTPVPEENCIYSIAFVNTKKTGLNIRSSPRKNSQSLGVIGRGQEIRICRDKSAVKVRVDGLLGSWQEFTYYGKKTYVFDGYLRYD